MFNPSDVPFDDLDQSKIDAFIAYHGRLPNDDEAIEFYDDLMTENANDLAELLDM